MSRTKKFEIISRTVDDVYGPGEIVWASFYFREYAEQHLATMQALRPQTAFEIVEV